MEYIKTVSGDTWDTIAKRVYGNELRAQDLMEERENIELLDIQVFPGGIRIAVPEVSDYSLTDELPSWRK